MKQKKKKLVLNSIVSQFYLRYELIFSFFIVHTKELQFYAQVVENKRVAVVDGRKKKLKTNGGCNFVECNLMQDTDPQSDLFTHYTC